MRSSFGNSDLGIARRVRPRRVLPLLPRERPVVGGEVYAEIELDPAVRAHLQPVPYAGDSPLSGRIFRIPAWDNWSMEQRIAFLRSFVEDKSRDPMIAAKAVRIIRSAGVPLRDHQGEWAALLKWVQTHVRFTAEPKERLQSPQYTLSVMMGDCDDLGIVLASLAHSIRLPFRFALLGRTKDGKRIRWIEGTGPVSPGVNWHHIYVYAGTPPFRPTKWFAAEPTLDVPLGHDPLTDGVPKGRSDLGAVDTALQRRGRGLGAFPWRFAVVSVVGSVLSYLAVKRLGGHSRSR